MRPILSCRAKRLCMLLAIGACMSVLVVGVVGCGSDTETVTTEEAISTTSSETTVDTAPDESTTSTSEETTTTGPEASTPPVTTEPLSNAETLLSNGRIKALGYIDKVWEAGGKRYISIDYIVMLTGEEANQAAVEDGFIEPGEDVPNDYYIVNQNPKKREFVVSTSVDVKIWTFDDATSFMVEEPITWAQFKSYWSSSPWDGSVYREDIPWWIERKGQEVLSISEQYLP